MNDKDKTTVTPVDDAKAAEIAKAEQDALQSNPNVNQNVTGTAHHGKDEPKRD